MVFDVARVRGLVPASGDGWVHLDPCAGMPMPEAVVAAAITALRAPVATPTGVSPASRAVREIEQAAREAVADLVGADPRGVVLGPGPAALLLRLAAAVSETWLLGDEIVLTRLDEPANVVPWQRHAARTGASVRRAEIDVETGELPDWQFDQLITRATRVVAMTAASPRLGTRPDVAAVADRVAEVRGRRPLLVVDASGAAPYVPLDIDEIGADVLVLDAGAWGGPRIGALVVADPALLDRMPARALDPAARGAARLELGQHPYPLLAALAESVEHLASLDDAAGGTRRERIATSLAGLETHQARLLAILVRELGRRTRVQVLGAPGSRIPALAFTHPSMKAREVVERLAERRICARADPGEDGALERLGAAEVGGAVRIALAHTTGARELESLVRALADLG
ncbi:MAG: aminotransferase class V-fold PLP-dependent enzyme [Pseudonocardia sp.]|nr:aminotransferase class V-fold PLP-dependent enzyme [Pseudonocardia sp.]